MRIGQGYDIHKTVKGRPLILGGVEIPWDKGLLGHSDADVLTHSIIDSIFGALGEGDIGTHFPDSDDEYKGINSLVLLKKAVQILKDRGYKIINIDNTLIAEKPKLSPFVSQMKQTLAPVLNIEEDSIGIKCKTNEGLEDIGKGKAIAAYSVVLIDRLNN